MKKVLLLNPPGKEIYIRDYYCSKVSKTDYIYHPVDLLIASSWLHGHFDLIAIDAIVEQLTPDACFKRVVAAKPDVILFLTGSVSYQEDFPFMRMIEQALPNVKIIGTGDLFMEGGKKRLQENPFLDAILLDFTTRDLLDYLQGKRPVNCMMYRDNDKITEGDPMRKPKGDYDYPLPRYELFPNSLYTYPFVKSRPFATVLTDYGCAFKCSFCIMSTIGFKTRSVDKVMEELVYIKSLGMDEVYFDDQTFGLNKKRTQDLLTRMIDKKLNLGWVCFSRVDVVTEDLLKLMQQAGCHTIQFGVETANEDLQKKYCKNLKLDDIRWAFAACRKLGIRTNATYLLGLPGESAESVKTTIDFAIELDSDYASFNIPVPRMNTPLRKESIASGIIGENVDVMDQTGTYVVMRTKELTQEQLKLFQQEAIRRFYFRPRYVLHRIKNLKSWWEVRSHFTGGISLIKTLARYHKDRRPVTVVSPKK